MFGLSVLFRNRDCTLNTFYKQPKNSVNVIFVGGSHINSGIIPNDLWKNNNITAENVYSWNQPIWIGYDYIKEALRTQNPDVVVVDLFGMTYKNSYIMPQAIDDDTYNNAFTIKPGFPLYEMMFVTRFASIHHHELPEYLNLVRYHSRWEELFSDDFFRDSYGDEQRSFLHGYGINLSVDSDIDFDEAIYDSLSAYKQEPYKYAETYLRKIYELSLKKGFQLVLVTVPYAFSSEGKIYNYIGAYANENGIPYLSQQEIHEKANIDFTTDFADKGHLNYYGAKKVTAYIGDYLEDNYSFTRPSSNVISQRNTDSEKFARVEKYNLEVFRNNDVEDYLKLVSKDNMFSYLLIQNDAYPVYVNGEQKIIINTDTDINFGNNCLLTVETDGHQSSLLSVNGTVIIKSGQEGLILYDKTLDKIVEYAIFDMKNITHYEMTTNLWQKLNYVNK